MRHVVFWQTGVSPHQAYLAESLARRYKCAVTFVAQEEMSAARVAQGWSVRPLEAVTIRIVADMGGAEQLVQKLPEDSIWPLLSLAAAWI